MTLAVALQDLCDLAESFFLRGYAFGSTGNLSIRAGEQVWITPTGVSLRKLMPAQLACVDSEGRSMNENAPSKEYPFHLGAYRAAGERAGAIVHLHSPYAVALSCLADLSEEEPLPALTPYYLMRVAPLAVVHYHRPGSTALGNAIERAALNHDCLLLRHHGVVCLGRDIHEAADRAEELEQTARLYFLLRGHRVNTLTAGDRAEIVEAFRR